LLTSVAEAIPRDIARRTSTVENLVRTFVAANSAVPICPTSQKKTTKPAEKKNSCKVFGAPNVRTRIRSAPFGLTLRKPSFGNLR
jgi:hypothetical protein